MITHSNKKIVDNDLELSNAYVNVFGQIPNLCNEIDILNYENLGIFYARHGSSPSADQYKYYYKYVVLNARDIVPNSKVEKNKELQEIWVPCIRKKYMMLSMQESLNLFQKMKKKLGFYSFAICSSINYKIKWSS